MNHGRRKNTGYDAFSTFAGQEATIQHESEIAVGLRTIRDVRKSVAILEASDGDHITREVRERASGHGRINGFDTVHTVSGHQTQNHQEPRCRAPCLQWSGRSECQPARLRLRLRERWHPDRSKD